jgi:hypothetical protein
MMAQKGGLFVFPKLRWKPESSPFKYLHLSWVPVFTGVTFYEGRQNSLAFSFSLAVLSAHEALFVLF